MKNIFDERASACALNRIFGYEPRYASELIGNLGSADAVFRLTENELSDILGPFSKYRGKINGSVRDEAARELSWLADNGCTFIASTEDCFPTLLRECEDAPAGLYVRSDSPPEEIFKPGECISVVGTRDISLYGKEWCPEIIGALSSVRNPPTIVSGLAFGVDICAHMAALAYGLPTIAVLPVGIDCVYPASHRVAAGKIASTAGCALITDYPPGTKAEPVNFLRRNRIIAGLSKATILVESKEKGGGTMTARLASGYGRDVFALPGRIDDIRSQGCNRLLAEKIAEPIVSVESLVQSLGIGAYNRRRKKDIREEIEKAYSGSSSPEEVKKLCSVAEAVKRSRGITPEEIGRQCGIPYEESVSMVSMLECDGFIDTDLYRRCSIHNKKS